MATKETIRSIGSAIARIESKEIDDWPIISHIRRISSKDLASYAGVRTALVIVFRILSITMASFAVAAVVFSYSAFRQAGNDAAAAKAHLNAAEDQPDGLDGLTTVIEGGAAVLVLGSTVVTVPLAILFWGLAIRYRSVPSAEPRQQQRPH